MTRRRSRQQAAGEGTSSLADKGLSILEGASVLLLSARTLAEKSATRGGVVSFTTQEVNSLVVQLHQGAVMIDNLFSLVEQREMPKLDSVGNGLDGGYVRKRDRTPRRIRRK